MHICRHKNIAIRPALKKIKNKTICTTAPQNTDLPDLFMTNAPLHIQAAYHH